MRVPCKNILQAAAGAACGHCRGGKGQVDGAVSLGVGQRQPAVQRQCEVPAGGGFLQVEAGGNGLHSAVFHGHRRTAQRVQLGCWILQDMPLPVVGQCAGHSQ